ncbi:tachykinin-like peptides receptor 86C [Dermacentor variabilis]|uniref:tachykinin-like peptides receptor 86C n=1 Tax=Dermacentor variabilis TaxID=34621 RepID=UPI003F5AF525
MQVSLLKDVIDPFDNSSLTLELRDNLSALVGFLPANLTAGQTVERERQWVLSAGTQFAYALLFGTVVLVAVCGNSLVVWSVVSHRRMRTVTNLFLVNLSVADFMTAVFNAAFNFVYMLESHWTFGEPYCVFSNFVANLTVACSAFTMAAMSIDRYNAVIQPLSRRLSRCEAAVTMAAIWAASALLSLPTLLFSRTRSYYYADRSVRTVCLLVWPDGIPGVSLADYLYNVAFLVLTYVVPVFTMAATYTRMSRELWGSGCIGEFTEHQHNALRNKQKVVRMLFTVVFLFTVCWLPYHVYFLYVFHHPSVVHSDDIQHVYLAMYWLAMSHAMYNPIVYYFMNHRFNQYFRQCLCCCCTLLPDAPAARSLSATARSSQNNCSNLRGRIAFRAKCRTDLEERNQTPLAATVRKPAGQEVLTRVHRTLHFAEHTA